MYTLQWKLTKTNETITRKTQTLEDVVMTYLMFKGYRISSGSWNKTKSIKLIYDFKVFIGDREDITEGFLNLLSILDIK